MLNKTIIQGRLTKDAELRETQSGTKVASFTVAWSEKYKDLEKKLFMPCVAWGHNVDFITKYFTKGQEICVEGTLMSRTWTDQEGKNRTVIELTVERAHFCGKKETAQATSDDVFDLGQFTEVEATDNEDLPF